MKIRAWLEERELDGLAPPLRAQVEVERQQAYEVVRPAPSSVQEIHDTLDRLLLKAGVTGEDAVAGKSDPDTIHPDASARDATRAVEDQG